MGMVDDKGGESELTGDDYHQCMSMNTMNEEYMSRVGKELHGTSNIWEGTIGINCIILHRWWVVIGGNQHRSPFRCIHLTHIIWALAAAAEAEVRRSKTGSRPPVGVVRSCWGLLLAAGGVQ